MTFTPFTIPIEPNAQILLDSTLSTQVQGASTPLAVVDPQNRPGWYYNSTLITDSFIWTIFNGTNQNFTFGDVQNLTFTATHDNNPNNKCYMAIYSAASKIVFENNDVELIPGEKCLFYTNTPPTNPEQLRLVQLNLVTKVGPCLSSESLLAITLEGTNVLQICVENIGYLFSQETVPVVVNLYTINSDVSTLNATLQLTNDDLTTLNDTLGDNTTALGLVSTNLGANNTKLGDNTIALDQVNDTLETLNGTLGDNTTALGLVSTNLGANNTKLGDNTIALDQVNDTLETLNGTLGDNTTALGLVSTNLGANNTKLGDNTIALDTLNNTLESGVITTSFPAINYDSFGRFRVSNPFTLFDSSNRYGDNGLWATSITPVGTATSTFNSNQGLMDLAVTTTTNSQVIRETYKVFPYQPGKSLLVLNTFVGITTDGVRQRIGYFGTENGIYFQINTTGTLNQTKCSIVKRSKVSGAVADTSINQIGWNGDKLDGTGPSGITLDLTHAQILWMDFEWLGVGSVRVGFVINGQFILCHTFHHANIISSTYITTASLPLRYEITNTGTASGTLKQICSSVISEGGYGLNGTQLSIGTVLGTPAAIDTTRRPVISIRLQSTRLDAIVILTAMNLIPSSTSNDTFFWEIIRGGVTVGTGIPEVPAWVAYTNSSVETRVYGAAAGTITMTNAIVMASGFISSTNQSRSFVELLKESLFTFQLQRNTFTSTAYEITLCCKSAGGGDVYGSIDWEEVSR